MGYWTSRTGCGTTTVEADARVPRYIIEVVIGVLLLQPTNWGDGDASSSILHWTIPGQHKVYDVQSR